MKIKEQLEINGYAFIPKWIPEEKTLNIAKFCGEIFSFNNIIGYQSIPEVQQLKPKKKGIQSNLYSSHFGLDYFPLHTDLAHWATPPRYLMLRCIKGCPSVKTHILPFNKILNDLQNLSVNRAIFSTRSNNYNSSMLLPMTFNTKKYYFLSLGLYISFTNEFCCKRYPSLFREDRIRRSNIRF